jgi:DNA processing protein
MLSSILKNDPLYPPLLREIHGAPDRLFCLGQKLSDKDCYFAIVGTRHASQYGKQMTEDFSAYLAARGFVIVSGLAYGIEAIAHWAALKAGGKTIAVLAAGLENITPPCNRLLAEKIQESGCLITEYEHSFKPYKGTFPQRNRIIAGMSMATLVIEAPERSGALITARLALEYNREVFALPGNITQDTCKGTNCLIRDCKAFPVTCVQDIIEQLEIKFAEKEGEAKSGKMPGGKNLNRLTQSNIFDVAAGLNVKERRIFEALKNSPQTTGTLMSETKLPAPEILSAISMLELKGLVKTNGSYVFVTR